MKSLRNLFNSRKYGSLTKAVHLESQLVFHPQEQIIDKCRFQTNSRCKWLADNTDLNSLTLELEKHFCEWLGFSKTDDDDELREDLGIKKPGIIPKLIFYWSVLCRRAVIAQGGLQSFDQVPHFDTKLPNRRRQLSVLVNVGEGEAETAFAFFDEHKDVPYNPGEGLVFMGLTLWKRTTHDAGFGQAARGR